MAAAHVGVALALFLQASPAAPPPEVVAMQDEPFHHLQFQNDRLALYDVVLPVGSVMKFHAHPTHHLAVVIEPGTLRDEGKGRPDLLHDRDPAGSVVDVPPGAPHRQTNIGTSTVHFLAVELLGSAAPGAWPAVARLPPGCSVVLSKSDARVERCLLNAGQALPTSSPVEARLRISIRGGPLRRAAPGGAPASMSVAIPGATWWLPSMPASAWTNTGTEPTEFVDIVLPPAAAASPP